jgi:hypothetical protein
MKFLKEMDKESFLQRYYLDTKMSAAEAFIALRKQFEIPTAFPIRKPERSWW